MAFFLLCLTLFTMFFLPTYFFPWLEPYQPLRNFAILALVTFTFSGKKSQTPFFSNKINVLFMVFVFTQILSAAQLWLTGAFEIFNFWLKIGICYYLVVKSAISVNKIIAICFSIVSGILYVSYFSISTFIINYSPGMRAGGFGWYEGANDIAIIFVSVIPLMLLVANATRSIVVRVLFTGSRNGLLGLLTVGALSLIFFKKVPSFVRFFLIGVLFISVFTVGYTNVMQRSDLSTGITGDASSENRFDQWRASLRMLKSKPLLGIGPGELPSRALEYGGVKGMAAHNSLLQVFAETGLLGGIAYSLFCFLPLVELRRLKKTSEMSDVGINMYKFIFSSLIGFWVCAFFSNRYQYYILYILVALLVAIKDNLINREANLN